MDPGGVRREIEQYDGELKAARLALAELERRVAEELRSRGARRAALEAQLASLEASLATVAQRSASLKAERALLHKQLGKARAAVERLTPSAVAPGSFVEGENLKAVVKPTGWRRSQPWYTRLLWAIFEVKEWK